MGSAPALMAFQQNIAVERSHFTQNDKYETAREESRSVDSAGTEQKSADGQPFYGGQSKRRKTKGKQSSPQKPTVRDSALKTKLSYRKNVSIMFRINN